MIVEVQTFKNKLVWFVLIVSNAYFIYGAVGQWFFTIPFGDKPAPNLVLILVVLTTLAIFFLFTIMRLKTTICKDKITVHFYPFLKNEINFNQIKSINIIKYKPLSDYGGWGIRYSAKGTAYTMTGDVGLEIILQNDNRILIGTSKPKLYENLNFKNYENDKNTI